MTLRQAATLVVMAAVLVTVSVVALGWALAVDDAQCRAAGGRVVIAAGRQCWPTTTAPT